MRRIVVIVTALLTLVWIVPKTVLSEDEYIGRSRGEQRRETRRTYIPQEVAALQPLSLMLGRPTDRSVAVNVLSTDPLEGYFEYGTASQVYNEKTDVINFSPEKPLEIILDKLRSNTRYFYRICIRKPGETGFIPQSENSFHTQRVPGSTFIFEIQGDSHPERPQQYDPELYARTLLAASADHPDFYLTIGDDFSVDTLSTVNADTVTAVYHNQRLFLGLVGKSAPIFLVNGNHEQAAMCNLDGTPNNVAIWAQTARNTYFPQPAPDDFYAGDEQPIEFIGFLRDYYAWTWGDALFVVIDPYWHSSKPVDNVFGGGAKSHDMWAITLGDTQYQWFKRILEQSKSKYKFVFTHHVLGTGRGGIELAGLYEWGGNNRKGNWEFDQKRPGWEMPIHQLMVKNGITIFFQGHDHLFARQQLDGIIYQTLPQPADPNYAMDNKAAYRSGDILPNSGRVRVTVTPEKIRVEYIRSYLINDATAEHPNGEVAFSYEIPASTAKPAIYGGRTNVK